MNVKNHKRAIFMFKTGQIIMAVGSLMGLLLSIYYVSYNNIPFFRNIEGVGIAFLGFAGCLILEKIKTNIHVSHPEATVE